MALDVEGIRAGQRAMWTSGDWPDVAQYIQPAADQVIERADIAEGQDVLDVGTGSGNAAIPAAKSGARVTGVDISPELFDAARKRASEAGVEIEWVEGGAGDMPFDDNSFDRVISMFGAMFDPDQAGTAAELTRVCRPGGMALNACWTPEGLNGRMLPTVASYMPPPPPELKPPVLWGSEEHVRGLFAGQPVELSFEKLICPMEFPGSIQEWVDYASENLGPVIAARKATEGDGKWPEVREKLIELQNEYSEPVNGGIRAEAEFLLTTARKTD
jgi:SAM-dependent methyltransferase